MYYELPGYGKLQTRNDSLSNWRVEFREEPFPEGKYRTVNDPIDVDYDAYEDFSSNDSISFIPRGLMHINRSAVSGNGESSLGMDFLMGEDNCKIKFYNISPSLEEAIKLDQFFDMYGYATNSVKVPNEDSRESWNYVKTKNVVIFGTMPVEAMACIKAMYNRGVRFWHTVDVGNYSLSNRDVKEVKG